MALVRARLGFVKGGSEPHSTYGGAYALRSSSEGQVRLRLQNLVPARRDISFVSSGKPTRLEFA